MSARVSLNGIAKQYDGKRVLSGVTFAAGRGEALGVIGPVA